MGKVTCKMSDTSAQTGKRLPLPFLVCLIVATTGLLLVSYSAGLALLLSIGTAWSLFYVAGVTSRYIRNIVRASRQRLDSQVREQTANNEQTAQSRSGLASTITTLALLSMV